MANEICLTASLTIYKPSIMSAAIGRSVTAALFSMTNSSYAQDTAIIALTATLIPLGQMTQPHWAYFKNLDGTNFIKIRNGAAGADFLKLLPGEMAFCPLLDTAVPYAIADTATCLLEYLIAAL